MPTANVFIQCTALFFPCSVVSFMMEHDALLEQLAVCVERGKRDAASPHPPEMRGEDGADEWTLRGLGSGIPPQRVLDDGLIVGMNRIGVKFREKKVFVPDVLLAARAMSAGMAHLAPYFQSQEIRRQGTFIIGTVRGDLHDIGKKLVGMIAEGAGWEVLDLGTDVAPEGFAKAASEHPDATVGMSALLTTTMLNMKESIEAVKAASPRTRIIVGGAPLSASFAESIGADAYGRDPQSAVDFLRMSTADAARTAE